MAAPCCQTPFLPWSTFNESCRDAAIDIALQYFNYGDNPQVLLGLTSASQRWCEIYFDGDFEYRPQRASLLTQLHSDIFNTSAARKLPSHSRIENGRVTDPISQLIFAFDLHPRLWLRWTCQPLLVARVFLKATDSSINLSSLLDFLCQLRSRVERSGQLT